MRKLPIFFSGVPAFFGATVLLVVVAMIGSIGGVLSNAIEKWFCYTKATESDAFWCAAMQVSLHHALLSALAVIGIR